MLNIDDIFIIPPYEIHGIQVPIGAEKGERIILMFEPTILYSLPGLSDSIMQLYNFNLITCDNMPEIHSEIYPLLLSCNIENQKQDIYRFSVIYSKIIEIFVIIQRNLYTGKYSGLTEILPGKRQDYVTKLNSIIQYIDDHLTEDITLEKAAKIANFSKFHFARIFKAYTNMSFVQFIKFKRIKNVEKMILDPKKKIIDIALSSGFGSIAAFNRTFLEVEKCTPSDFRKFYQGIHTG